MRFGLQDIKKTVYRRGGELFVSLHLLRPGELEQAISQLIAYHERMLGQPRHQFSLDETRACIGDYRLAQCLLATLSHWYHWQARAWDEVLQECDASGAASQQLLEAQINSPIALRQALYLFVNEEYHGFLSVERRDEALNAFANRYALTQADLEYLLVLDNEDEALLTRENTMPPTSQEVALLYNQWAFEAALLQASNVRFVIDCVAFSRLNSGQGVGTGIGAAIKRLCFLARKIGVYYDLAYEATGERDISVPIESLMNEVPRLVLTLYGPQEVTGAAQQYGLRLARLCRLLLGYGIALGSTENERERKRSGKAKQATIGSAIVSAEATVHFLQRSYTLAMDTHLLGFLQAETMTEPDAEGVDSGGETSQSVVFDSGIEQSFAEAFSALVRTHGSDASATMHGWQLEREPEPLLLDQSIFIPDFALTRPPYRIYIEILGFWTPAYRERKIHKLRQLEGRKDILLVVPREAESVFASLAEHFPIIVYHQQLAVTDLLQVLETHYNDSATRLMQIDVEAVRALLRAHGWLAERESYTLLHCYSSSELQQAASKIVDSDIGYQPGAGFYQRDWLASLHREIVAWLREQVAEMPQHSVALVEVLQAMRELHSQLANCEDAVLEVMLGDWPELQIQRRSIFDAIVQIIESKDIAELDNTHLAVIEQRETSLDAPVKQVIRQVRERRLALKKRTENAVKQQSEQPELWGNIS